MASNVVDLTGLIAHRSCTFTIKEDLLSWSHDDFTVTDTSLGVDVFKIQRRAISMIRQKKTLYDQNGSVVWVMKHPLFKWFHRVYKFEDNAGKVMFKIRNHHRWFPGQGKKLSLKLRGDQKVMSRGNLADLSTDVTLYSGKQQLQILGNISKQLISLRSYATGLNSYVLTVNAGSDIGVLLAMVMVLDEERERKKPNEMRTMTSFMRPMGGF